MNRDTSAEIKFLPDVYPESWSSDWGQDNKGLWMSFTFKGIRQTFRWIPPGKFMMGSPEDEPERFAGEVLHEVTLTKGYWLADTTCTQELWQAVMGKNPSDFKGANRPVENVSYEDVLAFIEKFNSNLPELKLRLPTESEWENACRAGTRTPFSFGENITTDQVNYDGDNPYNNGKKGKYRGETVEVKSLPGNDWGFYEMNGNVWEWCKDWYGKYPEGSVVDPAGPGAGDLRVLRGGSWLYGGRDARSADRFRDRPGNRFSDVGFRLARGE